MKALKCSLVLGLVLMAKVALAGPGQIGSAGGNTLKLSSMTCLQLQKAQKASSQNHKNLYCQADKQTDLTELNKITEQMEFETKRLVHILNLMGQKNCEVVATQRTHCPELEAKIKACQKAVDENDMEAYRKVCY